jgi:hypothetical protein
MHTGPDFVIFEGNVLFTHTVLQEGGGGTKQTHIGVWLNVFANQSFLAVLS